jgi:uncharacterized protein (DUF1800 family)
MKPESSLTRKGLTWLAPWKPTTDNPWDCAAAAHLLRRTALFHEPARMTEALAAGPEATVGTLLEGWTPGPEQQAHEASFALVLASESRRDLRAWWWYRMLIDSHPLRSRMNLFWHDHFATGMSKVANPGWMAQQLMCFDRLGLDRFGDLLAEVAKGPAMIRWLDNESNEKGRANENFARELLELFTLGRDQYTENDIKEAARAFTGWRIRRNDFFFDRSRHDAGDKTVLGKKGRFNGDQVLAIALESKSCSWFLAGKLLAAFVGPGYPKTAQEEMARVLRLQDGRIDASLAILLRSKLFFDKNHRSTRIRGPVEWMLWALRGLGATVAPDRLQRAARDMGQELFEPPDVSGWDEEEAWVNSATWIHRHNFANRLAGQGLHPELEVLVPAVGYRAELDYLLGVWFPEGLPEADLRDLESGLAALKGADRQKRLAVMFETLLMLPSAHRL